MANFRYTAKNEDGKAVSGLLQADNEPALLRILSEQGLFPIQVTVADDAERKRIGSRKRIKSQQIGQMFGQMSDLLRSGMPMLRTMKTLEKTAVDRGMISVIRDLREGVSEGRTLAEAIADSGDVFESLHSAMIRAGEEGGFLEDVLDNLAQYIERKDELRGRVLGMMLYPMLLLTIGGLIIIALLMVIIPRFKPYFVNIELPVLTRVLFFVSDFLTGHFVLLISIIVLLVVAGYFAFRSETGRLFLETLRYKAPMIGNINRAVSTTRFCRILGMLLKNGVHILEALTISRDATGSMALASSIDEAIAAVRDGKPLAAPLRSSGQFDIEITEMIAVAEESNRMETSLVSIADSLERRTNRKIDITLRLIEPLILVIMAGLVAIIAVGLLYPVFILSQSLQ